MKKEKVLTDISQEALFHFAKRRYSVSASRFAKWVAGLQSIPKDHGYTAVRRPDDDRPKSTDAELSDFQKIAIERGDREHEWFDASCRYWSSDEGKAQVRTVSEKSFAAFKAADTRCKEIAAAKPAAIRRFNALRRTGVYAVFAVVFGWFFLMRTFIE